MRETEILVEQQPPQGVLVCDHAGLVINKFSLALAGHAGVPRTTRTGFAALVAAPTPLLSMTVSGRSMGAPATIAISIPGATLRSPISRLG